MAQVLVPLTEMLQSSQIYFPLLSVTGGRLAANTEEAAPSSGFSGPLCIVAGHFGVDVIDSNILSTSLPVHLSLLKDGESTHSHLGNLVGIGCCFFRILGKFNEMISLSSSASVS